MELWATLSISAAFLQNLRSALQKTLTARVGVLGAAYARFVFAAPWAVLLVAAIIGAGGADPPGVTSAFAAWALAGALGQIAGTLLLLHLFSLRNFAVGNTFAKTETVQAAMIGLIALGDRIAPLPLAGILVSLVGVVLLSATRGFGKGIGNRAAGIGLATGAAFALSGVAYRGAGLALAGDGGTLVRAAFTLACVTVTQTVILTLYMLLRAPGGVAAVLRAWRIAAVVGAAGMLASLAWFAAFTLISAAHVKAVGQVELVFSLLTAYFVFGERPTRREACGILLVASGILLLVLAS
jgi:drug/metabolite transporter (DMT)-like permease